MRSMTFLRIFVLGVALISLPSKIFSQTPPAAPPPPATPGTTPPAPQKVVVDPVANDDQIAKRLEKILVATQWFEKPRVEVKQGVVFLYGTAETDEYKSWAGTVVQNTEDVVAVVNKMDVKHPDLWNFGPALRGISDLWRSLLRSLPFIGVGLLILGISLWLARMVKPLVERLLVSQISIPLLRDLIARICSIVVLIIGLYLTMSVSGTTQLALTLLGGTGLIGLVLGIAFKDITENFLASIFLSMQRPFQTGDLVEIVDIQGYVQRLTVRSTIVITVDGNYVQIPNAIVYKNTIRNFTNNPNRRDDFEVFLPHDKSITLAQETAMKVLNQHPDVLKKPEALVLVEKMTPTTINLRIYYWTDCVKHNPQAIRSSVLRLIKHAFYDAKLLILPGPDEIVFPKEIPIRLMNRNEASRNGGNGHPAQAPEESQKPQPVRTDAERSMNEAEQMQEQAEQSRMVESDVNLLNKTARTSDAQR